MDKQVEYGEELSEYGFIHAPANSWILTYNACDQYDACIHSYAFETLDDLNRYMSDKPKCVGGTVFQLGAGKGGIVEPVKSKEVMCFNIDD